MQIKQKQTKMPKRQRAINWYRDAFHNQSQQPKAYLFLVNSSDILDNMPDFISCVSGKHQLQGLHNQTVNLPTMQKAKTVAEYIAITNDKARDHLIELRECLKKIVSDAEESLKWSIPAFSYNRVLFTYAAFQNHVAIYPTPAAIKQFEKELQDYKTGKGSIQFPLDQPLPKALITKIAKFRVKDLKENDARWM